MQATEKEESFAVSVNGVRVGSIPQAEFEQVQKSVRKDLRVWARWVSSGVSSLFREGGRLLYMVPMMAVWLVVMEALFMPDAFTQQLAEILTDPSQAAYAIATLTQFSCLTALIGLVIRLAVKGDTFDSVFSQEIAQRVRKMVKCPAEGELSVYLLRKDEATNEITELKVLH